MEDPNMPGQPAGVNPAADPAVPASPADAGHKEPDPVPYSRFKEVNDAKTAAEAERDREREEHEAALAEARAAKESKPDEDEWGDDETPLTKKDLKEYQAKNKKEQEEKETMAWYDNRHKELSKEIDGKDGRPAYVRKEIVDFAHKNPNSAFPDPQDVYNKLHFEKLVEWRADQKLKANKGGYVEKDRPPREPSAPDTSKLKEKDFDAHVREKYSS